MTSRNVYMDYAAATPPLDVAREAFLSASDVFANPSSGHIQGLKAKEMMDKTRSLFAESIAVKKEEIIFTPSGTAAVNLAIVGFVNFLSSLGIKLKKTHFLFSEIEHTSVIETAKYIEKLGCRVDYLKVDETGAITTEELKSKLKTNTVFVSIPASNSEVGVMNDLRRLSFVLKEKSIKASIQKKTNLKYPVLFSDMGQMPLYFSSEPNTLGIDFGVYDASKLYGLRGVAALFKKSGVSIAKILQGGKQEFDLWPGTEPIALQYSFARAFDEVIKKRKSELKRMTELRELFLKRLRGIEGVDVNSFSKKTLPNIVNISVAGNSEYLQAKLSLNGVHVSTKSACTESERMSHVVYAITKDKKRAENTLRFSFGYDTDSSDIEFVTDTLVNVIKS